jgi:flagellar basal body-associated protein FliL
MAEEKPKEAPKAEKPKEGKEGEEAAKAPKKGLNKKVLIIAGVIAADIALMAGLGFWIVGKLKTDKGPDPAAEALRKHAEEEKARKEAVTRIGHVLPKPLPFTVNIGGTAGESHYLKCAIQLEWEGEHGADAAGGGGGHGGGGAALDATGQEIEKRMPKITDIIINILSSQTYADLLKPAGKQKIKEAIVAEINAILPEPAPPEGEEKPAEEHGHGGAQGKIRNAFFTEFIVQ